MRPQALCRFSVPLLMLLANSEAAVWTAMLGRKSRSRPRCLIGFWASSGLIVDFANSIRCYSPFREGSLTVQEVADQTGVSMATLYRYLPGGRAGVTP